MPVRECSNGKWRIGEGKCVYETKEDAERAYQGYLASKHGGDSVDKFLEVIDELSTDDIVALSDEDLEELYDAYNPGQPRDPKGRFASGGGFGGGGGGTAGTTEAEAAEEYRNNPVTEGEAGVYVAQESREAQVEVISEQMVERGLEVNPDTFAVAQYEMTRHLQGSGEIGNESNFFKEQQNISRNSSFLRSQLVSGSFGFPDESSRVSGLNMASMMRARRQQLNRRRG